MDAVLQGMNTELTRSFFLQLLDTLSWCKTGCCSVNLRANGSRFRVDEPDELVFITSYIYLHAFRLLPPLTFSTILMLSPYFGKRLYPFPLVLDSDHAVGGGCHIRILVETSSF